VWARFSLKARHEFEIRAKEHRARKTSELAGEMEALLTQARLLSMREQEESEVDGPICMSACAVEIDDLAVFQRLTEDKEFRSPARIKSVRCMITEGPPPVKNPALKAGQVVWSRTLPREPAWTKPIIDNREFFKDAALVVRLNNGQTEYFKIVYAVQHPQHLLAVCKMELLDDVPSAAPLAGASAMDHHMVYARHQFKLNFARMMTAVDMPEASVDTLAILWNIRFEGGTLASTQWDPMPMAELIRGGPAPATAELKPKAVGPVKEDVEYEEMVMDMPWLSHLDDQEGYGKEEHEHVEPGEPASSTSVPARLFEFDEEACLAALDKVDRARSAEATVASDRGFCDFVTSECRGLSTFEKTGVYHDAIQGKCHTTEGEEWAPQAKVAGHFQMHLFGACGGSKPHNGAGLVPPHAVDV